MPCYMSENPNIEVNLSSFRWFLRYFRTDLKMCMYNVVWLNLFFEASNLHMSQNTEQSLLLWSSRFLIRNKIFYELHMDCRAVLFCSSKCHSVSLTVFHSDMNSHVSINLNQNKKRQRLTSICRHRGSSEFVLVLECYNLYQHDNQSFRLARSQVQQRLLAKNTTLCRHADKTPQLVSSPQGLTLEQQIILSSLGLPPCGKSLHFCVH